MDKPKSGIVVDGFCKGNPGPGGYRGIDIETKAVLFQASFKYCTNNIAEFVAVCHAIGYVLKSRIDAKIYTDSQTAIAWVNKKDPNYNLSTSHEHYEETEIKVRRCKMFLLEKKFIPSVEKWRTDLWGENPADFGHKK